MAEVSKLLLNVAAANGSGDILDCRGLDHVFLHLTVQSDGTALAASDVTMSGSILGATEGFAGPFPALTVATTTVISGPTPAGLALDATLSKVAFTGVASGRSDLLLRISNPPRLLQARWTYGSGGGVFSVRMFAWGWQRQT